MILAIIKPQISRHLAAKAYFFLFGINLQIFRFNYCFTYNAIIYCKHVITLGYDTI